MNLTLFEIDLKKSKMKKLALILFRRTLFRQYLYDYTVEPLKTDTPRDRPKCLSYRGVRLIEVLQSIGIRQKELKFSLL